MKIKYKNYEALMIHEKGNRTGFGCDFAAEALKIFKESKTAVRIVLFVATHNNTRLKLHAIHGMEFKSPITDPSADGDNRKPKTENQ
jgi:hypothetical protein